LRFFSGFFVFVAMATWCGSTRAQVAVVTTLPDLDPAARDVAAGLVGALCVPWRLLSPPLHPDATAVCGDDDACLVEQVRARRATHLLHVGVAGIGRRDHLVSVRVLDVGGRVLWDETMVLPGGGAPRDLGAAASLRLRAIEQMPLTLSSVHPTSASCLLPDTRAGGTAEGHLETPASEPLAPATKGTPEAAATTTHDARPTLGGVLLASAAATALVAGTLVGLGDTLRETSATEGLGLERWRAVVIGTSLTSAVLGVVGLCTIALPASETEHRAPAPRSLLALAPQETAPPTCPRNASAAVGRQTRARFPSSTQQR
jgi:hypothetical protein